MRRLLLPLAFFIALAAPVQAEVSGRETPVMIVERLPLTSTDEAILDVVRRWCALISAGNFDAAVKLVRSPNMDADELRRTIAGYGLPENYEEGHKLTPLDTAKYYPGDEPVNNPWPRHEVDRVGQAISVWFDLPLNGYWSDLTATFNVDVEGQTLILSLDAVHVM